MGKAFHGTSWSQEEPSCDLWVYAKVPHVDTKVLGGKEPLRRFLVSKIAL